MLLAVGVVTGLVSSLSTTGHGLDGPGLLAVALRVVAVLAGAAATGALLLHLCAPAGQPLPPALMSAPVIWARAWAAALAASFVLELASPSSIAGRAALGPDADAAATRLRWLVLGLGLSALVSVLAAGVRSRSDARLVLGLAVIGVLLAGGLGRDGSLLPADPTSAALLVHVLAASAWIGGLLALVLLAATSTSAPLLGAVALGYSRVALACYVAVAASGLFSLLSRTGLVDLARGGQYVALAGGKTTLLLLLGAAGVAQRRTCLRRLANGDRRALLALSCAELVLMAAAVGLAATLSHVGS